MPLSRSLRALALLGLLGLVGAAPAAAEPVPATYDVRLPPGTRADAQGRLVSGRGLRDTSDWIARDLDRRGIAVQRIGPYDVRGVEVTRFVSQTPSTPWMAIHATRSAGKTLISFVARPKSAATP